MQVIKYNIEHKAQWDAFVKQSDNFSFLFYRDYMEYHSDRFTDLSLMLFEKGKLKCLLPGNSANSIFYSHQGLTFGSMIHEPHLTFEKASLYLAHFISFLNEEDITQMFVKSQPFFYTSSLNQIQDYLFNHRQLHKQKSEIGAFIHCANHEFPKSSIEKRKLRLADFYVDEDSSLDEFWRILEENLKQQHGSKPVHTQEEIKKLVKLFPDNIKLFTIRNVTTNKIDAGTLLFDNGYVVKMQYIATSDNGRTNRAIHAMYYLFINQYKKTKTYIDMGTCMTDDDVNTSLLYLKQRFGAEVYNIERFTLGI